MLRAGEYRHRIRIQAMGEDESWNDLAVVPAAVNGLGGSEYLQAVTVGAQETLTFETRYSKALGGLIPQDCRIIFPAIDGDVYDVEHIDDFKFRHVTLKFRGVCNHGRQKM